MIQGRGLGRLTGLVVLFALAFCMSFASIVDARIMTLTVDELVQSSEYVVIAEVARITVLENESTSQTQHLSNELRVIKYLKGIRIQNDLIVLRTIKPENGWMEDNVELPPVGSRVLLFLARNDSGMLRPVNGIQGVWPMDGNQLLGMGYGRSLEDVSAIIKKQQASAEALPAAREDSIKNRDTANRLWAEGRTLFEKNRYSEALNKFRESVRVFFVAERQEYVKHLEAWLNKSKQRQR